MTDLEIIKVKRPDRYSSARISSLQPNRIPWNVFYIVVTTDREKISKLFKTAWIVFPTVELAYILRTENHVPPNLMDWCIAIPTYITRYKQYAYQYSRNSVRSKNTTLGRGLGKFFYLENGVFLPPCFYCIRSAHFLVGDCTPGTDSCLTTFWRGIEHRP
jgi:hypothetical protein